MRARHLAIAAAMAVLPSLAGAARADIALVNQTDVTLRFTITPYIPPDQMGMAVVCGQYDVAAGATESVATNIACGAQATVGANGPANAAGWSPTCSVEAVSWTSGRVTVAGTRSPTGGLSALVCTKQ